MKTITFLFWLFCFILPGYSTAQQLCPVVISTSGGFYSNASGMLSFTTGELSAVETFTTPSLILTQGFQQYWDLGTYVIEEPNRPISFHIHPNLSNGIFNLVVESERDQYVDMSILDLTGKEIFNISFQHDRGITNESIDISNAPQGMYLAVLNVKENKNSVGNHFFEKIQIIK